MAGFQSKMSFLAAVLLLVSLIACQIFALETATPMNTESPLFSVLVFSKTAGFRHSSIPDGIAAIQALGQQHNFQVHATEDAGVFSDSGLAPYRVVIFLLTSGDILNGAQQAAMQRFVQNGGGFVGIHSASDTEYGWPWYGQLVGAYFSDHPPGVHQADAHVVDPDHLSTQGLPFTWTRTDEWYNFADNPADRVNVLLNLDETTYVGGTMGDVHPISWYHLFENGRSWYTGMGHTKSSYAEPLFRQHILGGIRWAAGIGLEPAAYLPIVTNN
ncbi:MAG: ThuA domain-containing protein [Chloroflexota bacterium]